MAYMYFNAVSYPWHITEARELHALLCKHIPNSVEIVRIGASCGPDIPQPAHGAPTAMWTELLNAIANTGCLREFDAVLREMPLIHVHAALDKLLNAASPDSEHWILDSCIFINRVKLRKALATLAGASTTERVLVVRGEGSSGKSWTRHLVMPYASHTGQKCIYIYSGTATTVLEVVNQLCVGLEGTAPANFSTNIAWYKQVALHLQALAQAKGRGAWIIVDNLGVSGDGVPQTGPEVCDFFDTFAEFTADPNFAKWFRLILISYPDKKPIKWLEECFLEDHTAVSDLTQQHISDYLSRWAKKNGKALADSQAMSLSASVLQKAQVPVGNNDRRVLLRRVHDELRSVLETL